MCVHVSKCVLVRVREREREGGRERENEERKRVGGGGGEERERASLQYQWCLNSAYCPQRMSSWHPKWVGSLSIERAGVSSTCTQPRTSS